MKEHPILFSAPMVRALLSGTKTQTRRVIKGRGWEPHHLEHHRLIQHEDPRVGLQGYFRGNGAGDWLGIGCPYGQPGDRILVRETFYAWGHWETRFSAKKGRDEWHFVDMTMDGPGRYFYAADGAHPASDRRATGVMAWWKRPAIFMPKAASRITLEVTDVRAERLNSISEADAMAEGIEPPPPADPKDMPVWRYRQLWEQINGKGSWEANPWVWAVSFRIIKGGQR